MITVVFQRRKAMFDKSMKVYMTHKHLITGDTHVGKASDWEND